jgi:hypothetical protein
MRHTYMHLAVAALALSVIPAASQAQDTEVQVRGQSKSYTYFMDRKEIKQVSGTYAMSDGSYLDVNSRERKLYVWLDGRQNELHAIKYNVFATRDRDMTLTYADDGRYGNIAVSYVPRTVIAGGPSRMVFLSSK